jgi:signal transduction histidine kinase/PAS domain-containing protein/ActR/RegA family two-component response regulator
MPVIEQPEIQEVTDAPTLGQAAAGLREQLMDPSLWRDALEKYARATSLAVALADAEGTLLGECINPQPLWSLLRAEQPSAGACPFELVLSHESCTCVAAAFRQGRPVVAHGRSGLAHVAVPLVLHGEPLGALLAGQVFDQYPEQLPLEQLAKKFGIAPQAVWQLARLEHPVKEAVLRVYADLLMTLGNTFLKTRYGEVQEAARLAEMTRLRDRAVTEMAERERAESALERSELQFHNLLEKLPAGAYTCDAEGMITYFNEQAAQLWGRIPKLNDPDDRFCGSFKLYSPDGAPISHDQCWMALTLKTEREHNGREIVIERPDGRRFTVLAHINPIRDEAGKLLGAVNVVVDITQRKQADEALRRSEVQLEAELADTKLLHAVSGEMIHQEHVETLYGKIIDAAMSIMRSDFASMQMLYPERGTPGSGGELRLLAFRGFNPQAAKFWEWVRPTATCSCGRALSTGQRCVVGDIETCAWMADSDNLATSRDTGIRSVQSTPLFSRGGRLLGMISTHWRTPHEPSERDLRLLDVLARQAADLIERAQAEQSLQEADRRKAEFLGMLAHELRNPLAPIRNAVQVLRLMGDNVEGVRAASAMMERQVGQMVLLVEDLLDVSRITRGKIELRRGRVELASVVHHAVEAARPALDRANHDLTVTMPHQPVYLDADPTRLAQVVGNLLNNACKFTDRGGHIELTVSVEWRVPSAGKQEETDNGFSTSAGGEALKRTTHPSPLASPFAVIRVRDSGIGIAGDQLPRIFDLFMQVDTSLERSVSGLGIGLALVKSLVEMHGGTVEVHSEGVGRGSEFVACLPALVESAQPPPPEPSNSKPPAVTSRRILVVDDNRDSATSLAMLLKLTGNETHTAYDGEEAVEAAATFRPDVVLLDIGLPKLNGYEAGRRIREQRWSKGIVLVAVTGWGQEEDRQRSRDAGFDGHLVKPVDLAALETLLAELGGNSSDRGGGGKLKQPCQLEAINPVRDFCTTETWAPLFIPRPCRTSAYGQPCDTLRSAAAQPRAVRPCATTMQCATTQRACARPSAPA